MFNNRQPLRFLDKYTIRIKNVWLDLDEFKDDLIFIGMDWDDSFEKFFYLIKKIYGTIFIKYTDSETARLQGVLNFQKLYKNFQINSQIWNMSVDELRNSLSTNKVFSANEYDEDNNRIFLAGQTENNILGRVVDDIPIIQNIFGNDYSPMQKFLVGFVKSLALMTQPKTFDISILRDKGWYW